MSSFVEEGRRYRWVEHKGERRLIGGESSKLTLYDEFGIVYVGPGYSYTLPKRDGGGWPDGRVLEGYTDDPFFVQQYQEMWAEGAALGIGTEPTP